MTSTMNISVKSYRRRDGSIMIYLNNDRGVSLGLSPEKGYQFSKATAGEQKLWHAFCQATREAKAVATGADMAAHDEWKMTLFNGITFAITDVATVGGARVGSDGLYIVREDRVMPASPINDHGDTSPWFASVEI